MDAVTQAMFASLITWSATAAGAALVFVTPRLPQAGLRLLLGAAAILMSWALVSGLVLPAAGLAGSRIGWAAGLVTVGLAIAGGAALAGAIRRRVDGGAEHRPTMGRQMFLVMTLHHVPEGMAVGLAVAAAVHGDAAAAAGSASLVAAMAVHNAAEGALVSLPLRQEGMSRPGAWMRGQASGLAEVAGALAGAGAVTAASSILPWALAAAGGAMASVVAGDLLPALRESLRRQPSAVQVSAR